MKRRSFLKGLAATPVAVPLALHAQPQAQPQAPVEIPKKYPLQRIEPWTDPVLIAKHIRIKHGITHNIVDYTGEPYTLLGMYNALKSLWYTQSNRYASMPLPMEAITPYSFNMHKDWAVSEAFLYNAAEGGLKDCDGNMWAGITCVGTWGSTQVLIKNKLSESIGIVTRDKFLLPEGHLLELHQQVPERIISDALAMYGVSDPKNELYLIPVV